MFGVVRDYGGTLHTLRECRPRDRSSGRRNYPPTAVVLPEAESHLGATAGTLEFERNLWEYLQLPEWEDYLHVVQQHADRNNLTVDEYIRAEAEYSGEHPSMILEMYVEERQYELAGLMRPTEIVALPPSGTSMRFRSRSELEKIAHAIGHSTEHLNRTELRFLQALSRKLHAYIKNLRLLKSDQFRALAELLSKYLISLPDIRRQAVKLAESLRTRHENAQRFLAELQAAIPPVLPAPLTATPPAAPNAPNALT